MEEMSNIRLRTEVYTKDPTAYQDSYDQKSDNAPPEELPRHYT